MAQVYANLVAKGFKSLDDVPVTLRSEVEAILYETAG